MGVHGHVGAMLSASDFFTRPVKAMNDNEVKSQPRSKCVHEGEFFVGKRNGDFNKLKSPLLLIGARIFSSQPPENSNQWICAS